MVEMTVRDENIDVPDGFVLDQFQAERAQAGTGVENQNALAAANLDARSIAAVTNRRWAGAGNASSDTPKSNPHR
jgi:hypothetical protein